MTRTHPDFVIAGAAKAGTTALYTYLQQHPDLHFSPIKEPHFFSSDIEPARFRPDFYRNTVPDLTRYFSNDPLPARFQAFIRDPAAYQQLYRESSAHQLTGEASTTYLYSTVAARNLQAYRPDAKIILILRNPVERAYSHYLMALKFGFTDQSFRQALQADRQQHPKGWGQSELFLELGCYAGQVQRFLDHFPRQQVFIAFYEALNEQPQTLLKRMTDFLGVAAYPFDLAQQPNEGATPRAPRLNRLLHKSGLRTSLGGLLPGGLKHKLKHWYLKQPEPSTASTPEMERYLRLYYRSDVQQLSDLTGHDLSHWLQRPEPYSA